MLYFDTLLFHKGKVLGAVQAEKKNININLIFLSVSKSETLKKPNINYNNVPFPSLLLLLQSNLLLFI